jgi:SHS2 domain-containing protein
LKALFEILEHPSDIGIEARGATMAEAFQNAALGLMSIIAGPSRIESNDERFISLLALDRENLLVRWLTEILYFADAEKFLAADARFMMINDTSLKATVLGQQYDASKHELKLDVKAITYHKLMVDKVNDIWIARVFVDI